MFKKFSRGQSAEGITWIVATLIIIFILGIFIYVSSILGEGKGINTRGVDLVNSLDSKKSDLLAEKSFAAYLLTNLQNGRVYDRLQNEVNLNAATGDLAQKIFLFLYQGNPKVFGFFIENKGSRLANDFFSIYDLIVYRRSPIFELNFYSSSDKIIKFVGITEEVLKN